MKQENKYISLKELEEIIKDNRQRIKDFPTTNGKIEARAFNENQLQVLYLAKEYLEHGEGEYKELTDFYRNYTSILSKLYKPKPKKEYTKWQLNRLQSLKK